jgi:hypothetical protein
MSRPPATVEQDVAHRAAARTPWGAPASYNRAHVMDTLRQDFFDATASRQGFRSDHGQTGSYQLARWVSTAKR